MAFRFDARAALAEIRKSGVAPAIVAIPAIEAPAAPETIAAIATIAAPDLDRFVGRAAICEDGGGLTRPEAEAMTAEAQGFATPTALYPAERHAGGPATEPTLPTEPQPSVRDHGLHPDAGALLDFLRREGAMTYGAAASGLGWGATRAWQAEARLRAAGLVRYGEHGRAHPVAEGDTA